MLINVLPAGIGTESSEFLRGQVRLNTVTSDKMRWEMALLAEGGLIAAMTLAGKRPELYAKL
jgi:hypothetical protein